MQSMTAFGRGEATNGSLSVVVELRGTNHRFRDFSLKLPREYASLEPRVLATLKAGVRRGRVELWLRRQGPATSRVVADVEAARAVHEAIREVARALGRDAQELPLELVLAQPGVLRLEDEEIDPLREWDVVEPALEAALAHFADVRAREGEALQRDIAAHLRAFSDLLGQVEAEVKGLTGALARRLEERLQRLLRERVEPARLAQEAAIQADKADVSEELARLRSHLQQFRGLLDDEEPVGRRMEFLLQEMGREVNTLGSKAVLPAVGRMVVEMKSLLEKMREQAANVE